ncbi:glucoamylase [Lentinula aff. detonsa]|uniref:Glucoamylase n=1 Tax=Lentinula aff. detonsa TaxID=2804958 RepID=A0AA38NR51_9AGAR|nr:glucoamylase [Lentinula aff. detonsa]
MLLSSTLCALLAVGKAWGQSSTVDAYVASQSPLAKAGLLANIGPSGSKSMGAKLGIVVASPSSVNPDYLYTWTRDSAVVFQVLVDQFTLGIDTSTRAEIDNYVASQVIIQQVSNPSGTITTGGLGEPKFNIDETAFTGAWGRPQRDGPALRSTALITWANFLISESNTSYVTNTLWPLIQNDLNYVAQNWNQSTFDLWEEVDSSSFFTTAIQHRSLRQGVQLANALGQTSVVSSWSTQAGNLLCFLQSYWNTAGYITANTGGGRSGKDANTVLASIHTFDAAAGCDALTFQPCSDVALSNLLTYVNAFRSIYSINSGLANNVAAATGRYPEDSYMGGNPWYLTTLAVSEQLYDSLIVWNQQKSLNVTSLSLPFFQLFDASVTVGTYTSTSTTFTTLTSGVKTFADGFVATVAEHTPSSGSLSEQYSKSDGSQLSAADLTWSYAATLTSFDARAGVIPASWGAKGLTSSCSISTGGGGGGSSSGTVSVTFNVDATTVFGENIYICGSVDALQNWDPDTALILSAANYPIWSITVNLPANTQVQYKYIRKFGSSLTWESDPNDVINTPSGGSFIENDTWR